MEEEEEEQQQEEEQEEEQGRRRKRRRNSHQHLVLVEEVVRVLVQHHPPHGLQREPVLGPDLGHVQRVEVVLVLGGRVHCLDQQLPLRVIARCDRLEQVLGGVRVVGAADALGLVVEEALDAAGGLPVELDVGGLTVLVRGWLG